MQRGVNLTQYEAAHKKRTKVAALFILLLIPITIVLLTLVLGIRNYMLLSLIILCYTMIPFFMVFERRKPKAREVVLIAMMSALTVCVSLIFHMSLPIKGGSAMVIIAGISLGPEAGFLVGALSRFVLNFYQGQGAWTPFQMFSWGMMGFLGGFCFNRPSVQKMNSRDFKVVMGPLLCIAFFMIAAYLSYLLFPGEDTTFFGWRIYVFGALGLFVGALLQRKRLPADDISLTFFTFFAVLILYGGLMNICSMITSASMSGGAPISWDALKALYITGAAYDISHAGTSAIFMFLFGDKLIRKIERVKLKYGIYR